MISPHTWRHLTTSCYSEFLFRKSLLLGHSPEGEVKKMRIIFFWVVVQAGRPKKRLLFGHLFFNITNVFCAKHGWGMLVYAPGWSLPSQFWSYTPSKKIGFSAVKKMKIPQHWKRDAHAHFWKRNLRPDFFLLLFRLFSSETLSHRCRLSRITSNPAQKSGKIRPKLRFFCFSSENFGTILSRRSRISRTSRAPSQLSRPRPIDCDREPWTDGEDFPGFWPILFSNIVKENCS